MTPTLTDREILDGIKRVLETQLGESVDLTDQTRSLRTDFKLDSLDRVELAMMIEEEFGFSTTDAAEEAVETIADLVALVRTETDAAAALAAQAEAALLERAEVTAILDATPDPFAPKE
jgi:acyl carrier protein